MRAKSILFFLSLTGIVAGARAGETPAIKTELVTISAGRLGEQMTGFVRAAEPNRTDTPPMLNGLPAHLRFTFDQMLLPEKINYLEPQILIIPVGPYRALFMKKTKKEFDERLRFLNRVIRGGIGEFAAEIPLFPPPNANQIFRAQVQPLSFSEGSGVRFLTRYSQENTPTKNGTIFYAFEGITNDGKYLVSFFYPVTVKNLPISEDASFASMYMDQVDPSTFVPTLDNMDTVVKSITFKTSAKKAPVKKKRRR